MAYYKNLTECEWSYKRAYIYQITNTKNDNWYVRIRREIGDGTYYRQSLKTPVKAFALSKAYEIWLKCITSESLDIPFGKQGFTTVFKEFLIKGGIRSEGRRARLRSILKDYFEPFFGEMDILRINNKVWRRYLVWRRGYWDRKIENGEDLPSNAKNPPTLQCYSREKQVLYQFFKWCARDEYLHKIPVFDEFEKCEDDIGELAIIGKKQLNIRVPVGVLNNIKSKLGKYARENACSLDTEQGVVRTLAKWRTYYYVMLCYSSILRPTQELSLLKWHSIKIVKSKNIEDAFIGMIEIDHGKYKMSRKAGEPRTRQAVLTYQGVKYLMDWKMKLQELGMSTNDDDYVFPRHDGSACPTQWISYSFKRRLKAWGLEQYQGVNITLYSLRMSAITELIRASKSLGHVSAVSDASIQVISNNYFSEFISETNAENLANRFKEGKKVHTPKIENSTMEEELVKAGLLRKKKTKKKSVTKSVGKQKKQVDVAVKSEKKTKKKSVSKSAPKKRLQDTNKRAQVAWEKTRGKKPFRPM